MIISMMIFLCAESHVKEPLADLGLFQNGTFVAANFVGLLKGETAN